MRPDMDCYSDIVVRLSPFSKTVRLAACPWNTMPLSPKARCSRGRIGRGPLPALVFPSCSTPASTPRWQGVPAACRWKEGTPGVKLIPIWTVLGSLYQRPSALTLTVSHRHREPLAAWRARGFQDCACGPGLPRRCAPRNDGNGQSERPLVLQTCIRLWAAKFLTTQWSSHSGSGGYAGRGMRVRDGSSPSEAPPCRLL